MIDKLVRDAIQQHQQVTQLVLDGMLEKIEQAAGIVMGTLNAGNKILLFGNGGSAADAQHIAAEFTGRYVKERKGLPAIALTTDTSALTAISNDYGYNTVFKRQVEALANTGDLLIGLSTSGNSPNVLEALKIAKDFGCNSIGFSGRDGGEMNSCCDLNLVVPHNITARIQEMHILIGHILCEAVDSQY